LHNLNELNLNAATAGFDAVVSGHSHQPKMRIEEKVLFLNPGSAGPRRFKLPVSIGRLLLSDGELRGELIELDVQRSP
jgi:predicted phosphodiesterase